MAPSAIRMPSITCRSPTCTTGDGAKNDTHGSAKTEGRADSQSDKESKLRHCCQLSSTQLTPGSPNAMSTKEEEVVVEEEEVEEEEERVEYEDCEAPGCCLPCTTCLPVLAALCPCCECRIMDRSFHGCVSIK